MVAVNQVTQNSVLTTGELEGIDVLLVGYVDQINETIQPHPLLPELDVSSHPNPRVIEEAKGELASIFQISLHFTKVRDDVTATQIQFR